MKLKFDYLSITQIVFVVVFASTVPVELGEKEMMLLLLETRVN